MFRFYHYKNTLYLNTMFVFRDFFAFIAQYLSLEATYYLFFHEQNCFIWEIVPF